jgi:hypothetical protein
MKRCKPNKRRERRFDRQGNPNVVALWRRTRKGQRLAFDGREWGVEGRNGSDYYEIRVGDDGILYCSCPDYRFRGFKSNLRTGGNYLCKHVRAFLSHVTGMIEAGIAMDAECVLYQPEVALAYAGRFGKVAASKVA